MSRRNNPKSRSSFLTDRAKGILGENSTADSRPSVELAAASTNTTEPPGPALVQPAPDTQAPAEAAPTVEPSYTSEPATAVPAQPQHQPDEAATEATSEYEPPRTADPSPTEDRPAPAIDPKEIEAPAFSARPESVGKLPTLFLNPWEQEDEGPDPTFTELDVRDFARLRSVARSSQEEFVAAKLEIYSRQLWKQLKDEQGNRLFRTWGQFADEEWGEDRSEVHRQFNFLRAADILRAVGIDTTTLTVGTVRGLEGLKGLQAPEDLVEVAREVLADHGRLTQAALQACVKRRNAYRQGVAAQTYEQYKADLEAVSAIKQDGRDNADYNLIKDAEAMPGELAANIVNLAEARHKLPYMPHLARKLSGDSLVNILPKLDAVGKTDAALTAEDAEIRKIEADLKARKQKLKDANYGKYRKPEPKPDTGDQEPDDNDQETTDTDLESQFKQWLMSGGREQARHSDLLRVAMVAMQQAKDTIPMSDEDPEPLLKQVVAIADEIAAMEPEEVVSAD